uniref:Eukaryotic translation initiation factor 3 subunit L n=1 Tax=Steinernema glaseri TaxID=37863 RepID=A0A1I7ZQG7_9BILA
MAPRGDKFNDKEDHYGRRGSISEYSDYGDDELPNEVVQYLIYFKRMIEENNVPQIQGLYEHGWPDLTERFFNDKMWPDENAVENIVGADNKLFIILYKELYYRDMYGRMSRGPTLAIRYESYMNYQDLFAEILSNAETPIQLRLPNIWLWDIIDEFVYQFQAFCLYKANPTKRSPEDVDDLVEIENNQNAWNIYPVLNILYSLLSKSQINEQLRAIREGKNPDDVADDFGRNELYFKLGYFSLIGLLRTHVLLGDYHQALQTVENLEFDPKGLYNTVPSCFVTLHYFVGFSHMMMRNYGEATKIFINCLLYIQRTKSLQQQQQPNKKNYQYDVIGKTNDQLFHLLSICLALQPQRIDEAIQSQLYEKTGDRMLRMTNGDIDEFKNAFQTGCPKFLSPTTVAFDGPNVSKEPLTRQCNAFLEGIESQISLPILRGYLQLYTSLSTEKLAGFMDVAPTDYDTFIGKLLTFKMIVNELGKETNDGGDVDDSTTDLDFYVDKNMIVIADTKVGRRVGEYFIKHVQKMQEVAEKLKAIDTAAAEN